MIHVDSLRKVIQDLSDEKISIGRACEILNGQGCILTEVEAERMEWSLETFEKATPMSSLKKAESEIMEIEHNILNGIQDPVEYVDAIMCLLDSAGRSGITFEQIISAYNVKTQINKSRTWTMNPDHSYSHVKK